MRIKHNIISKGSTEVKIVLDGRDLGLIHLIYEQGYDVQPIILYQDNTSTITLMRKERSTSQCAKYIDTRYFLIKNRIELEEINFVHMGTKIIIADFILLNLNSVNCSGA